MKFRKTDKEKALAIVRIFETGTSKGDFGAVAVLNDGAGVSYGLNQFTHRSGALLDVIERYLELGGQIARNVIERRMKLLRDASANTIKRLAADITFKKALKAAAISSEMRSAQMQIAEERYLRPAIIECERLGLTTTLALSVVYDSITHGSWERIRDRVIEKPANQNAWITEYVRRRDAWLASIPRLAVTRYRTKFFLSQIAIGNWELKLPLRVHGVTLSDDLDVSSDLLPETTITTLQAAGQLTIPAIGPISQTPMETTSNEPQESHLESPQLPQAQSPGFLDEVERLVNEAVAKFDQTERVVITIADRTDRAKSLWTTFIGTIWQTLWAILGLVADVPREVWLVVAVIAGALMLLYLYRQMTLGRSRDHHAGMRDLTKL
ncbi:MAG TPA: chitosanase [Pyrinomonadaceae bacterium]|nr:chitosanase [Pyrinomonadaceae bacterium]